jgi:hypothetical protein
MNIWRRKNVHNKKGSDKLMKKKKQTNKKQTIRQSCSAA